jgi:hypothetical protein
MIGIKIAREGFVYPMLVAVIALVGIGLVGVISGAASPPAIRLLSGVLFVLGALYFRDISAKREDRDDWHVPLFGLIGLVFVISGARSLLTTNGLAMGLSPVTIRALEMLGSIGFLLTPILAWWWFGVRSLGDRPNGIRQIDDVLDRVRNRGDTDRNGSEKDRNGP